MTASVAGQTTSPSVAQKRAVIAAVLVGAFVFSLNARGTILESEQKIQAFGQDRYKAQWVTGVEAITSLTALFCGIYLIKVVGARRTYLLGAFCLAAGGLGEALARTYAEALVTGAVRNCASFYPVPGVTILLRLVPGHRRFASCTYLALVYGGQVVAEPVGSLVAFHPSWRALLASIGACGVALSLVVLCLFPDDRPERGPDHGFDWPGALLFVAFYALVLFLLYRGNYLGWRVSTPVCLAAAGVLIVLGLFVCRELVAAEPFMHLGGFASRTVALTMLASAFWCAALYGVAVQLPNCLLALGYQQWKTGWVILPMGLTAPAVMVLGGFVRHRGTLLWLFRIGLAGMTLLTALLGRIDVYTPWQWAMMVSTLWGFFAGLCLSPIAQLTFEGQPAAIAGATGAMKFFMRSFNGLVGILLLGVVIDQGDWWGLDFVRNGIVQGQGAVQSDVPAMRDHLVRRGSSPRDAEAQAQAVLDEWVGLHARLIGYRRGLRFCAWLSAAGLLVTLFIGHRKEPSIFDDG